MTTPDIAVLYEKIMNLADALDKHMIWEERNQEKNQLLNEKQFNEIHSALKSLDDRKADKQVQTAVYAVIGLIVTIAIVAVFKQIGLG